MRGRQTHSYPQGSEVIHRLMHQDGASVDNLWIIRVLPDGVTGRGTRHRENKNLRGFFKAVNTTMRRLSSALIVNKKRIFGE